MDIPDLLTSPCLGCMQGRCLEVTGMRLGSSLHMLPFWLAQPPGHLGSYLSGACLYSGLLGAEVVIVPVHIALSPLYQTCSSTCYHPPSPSSPQQ